MQRQPPLEFHGALALPVRPQLDTLQLSDLLVNERHDLVVRLQEVNGLGTRLWDVPFRVDENFKAIAFGIPEIG
jgi:hypothetical protein